MSDDIQREARELLDGISDGPWHAEPRSIEPYDLTTVYNVFHNGDTKDRDLVAEAAYGNAEFIAAAPRLVRELLAENEETARSRDNWKGTCLIRESELEEAQALAAWFAAERDHWKAIGRVRGPAEAWAKPDYTSDETACFGRRRVRRILDGEGQS